MRSDRRDKKKEFLDALGGEKLLRKENRRLRERERILIDALCEIKASHEGESDQPIKDIINGCMTELSNATKSDRFDRTTKFDYLEAGRLKEKEAKKAAYTIKQMKELRKLMDGE